MEGAGVKSGDPWGQPSYPAPQRDYSKGDLIQIFPEVRAMPGHSHRQAGSCTD